MLDLAATLTPDDLTTAHDTELMEYLAGVNDAAKNMSSAHLGYPMRHHQLDAVLSELERRKCLRIINA